MSQLGLTDQDIVILDRATGTGQAVFRNTKPAKLGVVVHAEHFSENAVTDKTNFYGITSTSTNSAMQIRLISLSQRQNVNVALC